MPFQRPSTLLPPSFPREAVARGGPAPLLACCFGNAYASQFMEFWQETLLENQEISSLPTQRKKRWHYGDTEISEKKVGSGV